MKKRLVVCLVLGVVLSFGVLTSCSNPAGGATDLIVGKWVFSTLSYTFNADGTYVLANAALSFPGAYTKTSTALHLTLFGAPFEDFTYTFGPNNATLNLIGTGSTTGTNLILTRQ